MDTAIVLHEAGGPEQLVVEPVAVPSPGQGEIVIAQKAIGVNFHDIYVRTGLYKTLPLPGVPGIEAAGIVDAVGPGVSGLAVGDKVAYIAPPPQYGAYASRRVLPAAQAIRLPDWMDCTLAAAVLLKGLTAEMLVNQVHAVQAGDTILVHAAAGGVGQLVCRWASQKGATVIGTVGSEAKADIARSCGCAHTILYRTEDVPTRVKELTNGQGAAVVYDSVGKDTFDGSVESLAMLGHLVNFGQSSGSIPPFEISRLAARSTSVSRPIIFHYMQQRDRLDTMVSNLFAALQDGTLKAEPGITLPLAEASRAQALMESRSVSGAVVLVVEA